jgi:2-polyprenyl-3-methyl-5-hydroxy-6-metoxy-1,4-benzoquinol methylase
MTDELPRNIATTVTQAEQMRRDYDAESRALPHHDFDTLMHGFMMRSFRPFIQGGWALELGCFHGAFTERLAKLFSDVIVIEGSKECIEIAKKRVPYASFVHGRFEYAPVWIDHERKFDAVFAIHVLEHLDDPIAVLKRCREWLKPDGQLFLAVPNAFAASRQIATKMGLVDHPTAVTAGEWEHGHRRTYHSGELDLDIHRAGMWPRYAGGVMFKPFANFQFDKALAAGIIDEKYLDACYEVGKEYPELCASLVRVCVR